MAAARSRQDVARLLRAHDLPAPVDESFVAVLAAQARATSGSPVAAPPRRALKLAGAAVAVVASTVGVAVAANQGLFVPPDPQHSPPATTSSDVPVPGPVDADDAAEERGDEHVGRPDASEGSAPREHRADAPDADDDSSAVDTEESSEQSRPAEPEGDRTKGGTGGEDGPGAGPADDTSGDDETEDSSDDGADESESPEPDESETDGPESDEPESDDSTDGADSSETSDPEPDEVTESAGVDDSEDALSG